MLDKLQEEMASAPATPPPAPVASPKENGLLTPARRTSLSNLVNAMSGSSGDGATSKNPSSAKKTSPGDDGVKKALAKRLESLLEENVMIKEKVSMLEGIVQELTDELNIAKSINTAADSGSKKAWLTVRLRKRSSTATAPVRIALIYNFQELKTGKKLGDKL